MCGGKSRGGSGLSRGLRLMLMLVVGWLRLYLEVKVEIVFGGWLVEVVFGG